MKRIFLCLFNTLISSLAAESEIQAAGVANKLPDPASILFTPPPPPKELPAMEVKDSNTVHFGTHQITILRGESSTLPDIPEPPPVEKTTRVEQVPLVASRPVRFISGKSFGKDLSRVEVWNPGTQTRHIGWCGWDISLSAPFHEITHQGETRLMFVGISTYVATSDHPEVEAGSILVPDGDTFTASVLTSMRDVHFQNLPKLLELRTAQEQFQKDSAAWHAANPPRPQNHTIWIKPHRGSRYLKATTGNQEEGTR
jgi:hypothetical protein